MDTPSDLGVDVDNAEAGAALDLEISPAETQHEAHVGGATIRGHPARSGPALESAQGARGMGGDATAAASATTFMSSIGALVAASGAQLALRP